MGMGQRDRTIDVEVIAGSVTGSRLVDHSEQFRRQCYSRKAI